MGLLVEVQEKPNELEVKIMQLNWQNLSGSLLLTTTLLSNTNIAQAEPYGYSPVSDQFNQTLFRSSGDFFQGTGVFTPAADIFGVGAPSGFLAFPERTIERDASAVHGLYRQMMQRQVSSDPIIRVPDMPNPFTNSVMTMPTQTLPYPAFGQ